MADILVESFNAAGYDNAGWTEVVGAGSTVDEDSTDIADSAGGATQILKVAKVSPNFNAMTRHDFTSAPIVYLTAWVYVASYTLPSAGNNLVLLNLLDVSTNYLLYITLHKTSDSGNPVKFRASLRGDEVGNYPASGSIATGQWYKIGLKYDNTNDAYDFSVNDVSIVSGAMAHGNNVTRIKVGDNDSGMAFAGYFDEIHLSDSSYYTPITDTELVVADCSHAHAADGPVLTQAHTLAVADATHGHTALGGGLAPTGIPDIGAYEYHPPGLELEQGHLLVVGDALHAQAVDAPVLVENKTLVVAESLHGHVADSVILSSAYILVVADTLHAHESGAPVFVFKFGGDGLQISVGIGVR